MIQALPLTEILLALVPVDGSSIGNQTLFQKFSDAAAHGGQQITEADFEQTKEALITAGVLARGKGRGGSVHRCSPETGSFGLAVQAAPAQDNPAAKTTSRAKTVGKKAAAPSTAQIISYRHPDKRVNNPEVGMVTPATDPEAGKTRWIYDPHIDPALQFDPQRAAIENLIDDALASDDPAQMRLALAELKRLQSPYLNWAGKAERTSFDVDTVSLHVHERIDPASILAAVRKAMKEEGKSQGAAKAVQPGLFDAPFETLSLRDAIDFYRHERGWANRLIAGDSLLVMNSLLQKESMAGKLQMIYIDPPYGIKYGSNFQPFVGKRDVKDRNDADLTQEPEMIKAFRDTWELGIHSYLTYLRDRLLLARELLNESGSVFVQISDENLHHVREIMDEVFGTTNFVSNITVAKTTSATSEGLAGISDYVVWYSKAKDRLKYHQLFFEKIAGEEGATGYTKVLLPSGEIRRLSVAERSDPATIPKGAKIVATGDLTSQRPPGDFPVDFRGKTFVPVKGYWKTGTEGFPRIIRAGRVEATSGGRLSYVRHLDDFPAYPLNNLWVDTVGQNQFGGDKLYVVQTANRMIERCMLMTTDPGDLVLDPTCGSGTTAFVAEKWGRRWITCDTSRVAATLAKQRLMTASYDYYELKYPHEGLRGGFIFKTVPHVTLKSIANNPDIDTIHAEMHPAIATALADLNASLASTATASLSEWDVPFDLPAG
jgi:adenine-specific DNA-methyltransferase